LSRQDQRRKRFGRKVSPELRTAVIRPLGRTGRSVEKFRRKVIRLGRIIIRRSLVIGVWIRKSKAEKRHLEPHRDSKADRKSGGGSKYKREKKWNVLEIYSHAADGNWGGAQRPPEKARAKEVHKDLPTESYLVGGMEGGWGGRREQGV